MSDKPNPEDYELVPNNRGGFDIKKKDDSGWWLMGLGLCGALIFAAVRWVLVMLAAIPVWAYIIVGGLVLLLVISAFTSE
jgi:uncharacterized membrane protein